MNVAFQSKNKHQGRNYSSFLIVCQELMAIIRRYILF
jgi:hypothetical protein